MTELERSQAAEIKRLREENRLLREKLDLVIRQLFGKKSEKLDPAQLELLLSDLDDVDAPGKDDASTALVDELVEAELKQKRGKRTIKERRSRIPEHLPVVETVIEPESVKACPEAWRKIGEEVSEMLDYEPGRFLCLRTVRPKYARRSDREAPPITAPLPPKLVEGGIGSPGLIAHIVIQKYCDHLPLYRQEQIFRSRNGVELPRQTMARWVEVAADWLRPIYDKMREAVFAGGYLEIDETPVKFLQPGEGKTGQGYLWVYRKPGGDTLFDWHAGRGHECLVAFIPDDFTGVIQCDGYSAYRTFAKKHQGEITLAGCWAHARRKFRDAFEVAGKGTKARSQAAWFLRQIQHLYAIERDLRDSRAGPALRQARRQSESRLIIDRIHRALFRLKTGGDKNRKILPKSVLGRAIDYALNQWPMLTVFVDDGRVEIDNNLVENAIRPTAIGKKNWLFIGDKDAGWRSAVLYSIIESCRSRGINPLEYLRDVLTQLPETTNWEVAELTPEKWAANRGTDQDVLLQAA